MKTLAELKEMADENNHVLVLIYTPWDQTSLARLYDHLNESCEKGSLIDIVSAHPQSMDWSSEIMEVKLELDISDALDLPEDTYFSEFPEDAEHVARYKKEMGVPDAPSHLDGSDKLSKDFGRVV